MLVTVNICKIYETRFILLKLACHKNNLVAKHKQNGLSKKKTAAKIPNHMMLVISCLLKFIWHYILFGIVSA